MENKSSKVWVALVVILVIAIGGYFLLRSPQVQNQVQNIGAVPTLDGVDHPFVTINGQREWYGTVPMVATSSVVCSIQNPLGATSSIEYVSAEVTNRGGLSQPNMLDISTSSNAFATSSTSLVRDHNVRTGQFSIALAKNGATTTSSTAHPWGAPALVLPGMTGSSTSNYILGPSERVQWVIASSSNAGVLGGAGTFLSYWTGKCSLQLKKI